MQFFMDSIVMNVISFAIALTLVQVIGKIAEDWFQFYIPSWNEISLKTTIVILSTLGVGVLIATLYPLVLIARRKPDELLKKLKGV
jgi:putative Mn2+ efflux pump MntP